MRGLTDKVAIVSGAGSGIGRATAIRLAEEGVVVAAVDIQEAAVNATVRDIQAAGGRGLALTADATSVDEVDRALSTTVQTYGGLDVIVNGVARVTRTTMYDLTFDQWNAMVSDCLSSYFIMTKLALPHLIARGGGKIVNICSIAAHIAYGEPAYTAAKGGVLAWSREAAVEFAHHGINVNTVSPGLVETAINSARLSDDSIRNQALELIPVGRIGRPEDIAAAIAFLSSADADYITGADLVVDGSMSSSIPWGTARDAWRSFVPAN
jgi:NAD(P)-dependent dehydrogenase (short-subunit alcohol dehydrogenase family)